MLPSCKRGFTLTELLVVLAVLVIVSTIVTSIFLTFPFPSDIE